MGQTSLLDRGLIPSKSAVNPSDRKAWSLQSMALLTSTKPRSEPLRIPPTGSERFFNRPEIVFS